MAKNLSTPKSSDRSAGDNTPSDMKTLDPAPGGKLTRDIKGPSIHTSNKGGDLKNNNGIDGGTSVESP